MDAINSNFENFESTLNMKSVSMPFRVNNKLTMYSVSYNMIDVKQI